MAVADAPRRPESAQAGAVGKLLEPSLSEPLLASLRAGFHPRHNPQGFVLTTVLGIVGSVVATFLGRAIHWYGPDQGAGLIASIVGAVIVLGCWHALARGR